MVKKPFYRRVWFWLIFGIVALGAISIPYSLQDAANQDTPYTDESNFDDEDDSSAPTDDSSEASTSSAPVQAASTQDTTSSGAAPAVPIEYTNALAKAQSYVDDMAFSKARLMDQLTSEYGERFSQAAAEYAVAHVHADYNANALQKAREYQNDMQMSPSRIRDQLTSAYGERFTPAEADYALAHLNDP